MEIDKSVLNRLRLFCSSASCSSHDKVTGADSLVALGGQSPTNWRRAKLPASLAVSRQPNGKEGWLAARSAWTIDSKSI